jgi:hypothetical protein
METDSDYHHIMQESKGVTNVGKQPKPSTNSHPALHDAT